MEVMERHQFFFLSACSCSCLLLILFSSVIKFRSLRKKRALIKLEAGVMILLFADAIRVLLMGGNVNNTENIISFSSFLINLCSIANLYFMDEYITSLFMETGKFDKLPRRLLWGYIISTIEMSIVVIAQLFGFFGMQDSFIKRSIIFVVVFLIPFVTAIMLFSFVTQYRKLISKRLFLAIIIFSVIIVICETVQLIDNRMSLVNLATWLGIVTVFVYSLKDQNDELVNAANSDMQTGLPNTFGYIYEVDRVIFYRDITQYAGLYFDIIRMSHINNKYGKKIGDEIIEIYASKIHETMDSDEILGRLGGNYFVALVKKDNLDKFVELLKDVTITFDFAGEYQELHIAAFAGIYEVNKKNISGGQILSNCATAVVHAKTVAHQQFVYLDESLEKELLHIQQIEDQTRKALLNKEFEAFYQPKVDTNNNTICGAEAMARWKKDGEWIAPGEFVPVMERNSSICGLDFYILERVCEDIKDWINKGITPVTISVNFSRRNLGNPTLAEDISKVVEKSGIPKEYIQIEITETIDDYPMSYLIGVVEALQRYGLTVAIDDFGTGSSSIGLLKDVEFDVLKIDKSFIDYENEQDKELLRDIIHIAKNRQISVIAEGVETMEQVEELKEMGCYAIQGYVFDRPLGKLEFEFKLVDANNE